MFYTTWCIYRSQSNISDKNRLPDLTRFQLLGLEVVVSGLGEFVIGDVTVADFFGGAASVLVADWDNGGNGVEVAFFVELTVVPNARICA